MTDTTTSAQNTSDDVPLCALREIRVSFGGLHAGDDVSIDMFPGEVVAVGDGNTQPSPFTWPSAASVPGVMSLKRPLTGGFASVVRSRQSLLSEGLVAWPEICDV